jgi:hypothetical protein
MPHLVDLPAEETKCRYAAGTSVDRGLAPHIKSQNMIGSSPTESGNATCDTSGAYRGTTNVAKELAR